MQGLQYLRVNAVVRFSILKGFPNLQELFIINDVEEDSNLQMFLKCLEGSKLRSITLDCRPFEFGFETFKRMKHVKKLTLCSDECDQWPNLIESF